MPVEFKWLFIDPVQGAQVYAWLVIHNPPEDIGKKLKFESDGQNTAITIVADDHAGVAAKIMYALQGVIWENELLRRPHKA